MHSHVSDAMKIDDAVQQDPIFIRVIESAGNLAKDFSVASSRVVEAEGVDEVDCPRRREFVCIYIDHDCVYNLLSL